MLKVCLSVLETTLKRIVQSNYISCNFPQAILKSITLRQVVKKLMTKSFHSSNLSVWCTWNNFVVKQVFLFSVKNMFKIQPWSCQIAEISSNNLKKVGISYFSNVIRFFCYAKIGFVECSFQRSCVRKRNLSFSVSVSLNILHFLAVLPSKYFNLIYLPAIMWAFDSV